MGFLIDDDGILQKFYPEPGETKIMIPNSVRAIGDLAFKNRTSLTDVVIPGSVLTIGKGAFQSCSKLSRVVILQGTEDIGDEAFWGCRELQTVVIPDSVRFIGASAFSGCSTLRTIRIPNGVEMIGEYAFHNCVKLSGIALPNSVRTIARRAFMGCEALRSVVLPPDLINIRSETFAGCSELASIVFPNPPFYAEKDAFPNSLSLSAAGKATAEVLTELYAVMYRTVPADGLDPETDAARPIRLRFPKPAAAPADRNAFQDELWEKSRTDPAWYIPYAIVADEPHMDILTAKMKTWTAANKNKQLLRVRAALFLSKTTSAMRYLDSLGLLERYADMHRTYPDTLRDGVMADLHLDEAGTKTWALPGGSVTAVLCPDMTIVLRDEGGNTISSIPGSTPEGAAAAAELARIRKVLNDAFELRKQKLFEDFLSGRKRPGKDWKAAYQHNAMLRYTAGLLVWDQNGCTFTLHEDGSAYRSNGSAYRITDDDEISVAHPMEMKKADLKAWQQHFISSGPEQPFRQLREPVIGPQLANISRYENCLFPLQALTKFGRIHGIRLTGTDTLQLKEGLAGLARDGNLYRLYLFHYDKYTRLINHIAVIFDIATIAGRVCLDDITVAYCLDELTPEQILDLIDLAAKNSCANVNAILQQYKREHFKSYDPLANLHL